MNKMTAQEVFFVFEGRGIQPGSFTYSLINTIVLADIDNRMRLALSFPEYVQAVRMYKESEESYAELEKLAFGE